MARKPEGEEEGRGIGLTERVTGTMKRAVGAVGRAARGAVGRPEAGTDALFQALHADHEEVAQLLEKLMGTRETARATELWTRVSVALLTHARAEQETVYARFADEEELADDADHSLEEHEHIEEILLEANELAPGTEPFVARVRELDQVVREHVDDEENDLLPKAAQLFADPIRERLTDQFRARKEEIEPKIALELTGRQERPARAPRPRADKTRKARPRPRSSGSANLEERTVKELQEMAKKRGIEGRSRMSKKELVAALSRPA